MSGNFFSNTLNEPAYGPKNLCVVTPLWDKCEDEIHTPKSGKLESFRTPKNSKLEFKGQNTLH